MKKFKVLFSPPAIKEEEIEQHKDFDSLLKAHKVGAQKLLYKKIIYSIVGATCIMGVSLLSGSYLFDEANVNKVDRVEKSEEIYLEEENVSAEKPAPEMVEPVSEDVVNISETEAVESAIVEVQKTEPASPKPDLSKKSPPKVIEIPQEAEEPKVAIFTEAAPVDGYDALYKYFKENMNLPERAVAEDLQGTVIVSFFINEQGRPEDMKVVKSLSPEADEEAIRLVENMPLWIPARAGKNIVKTQVALPVDFNFKKETLPDENGEN